MKHRAEVYLAEELNPDGVPDLLDAWFDEPVVIYIDCLPAFVQEDRAVILCLREPDEIYSYVGYAIANQNKYRYILTYDDRVLQNCPNAIKLEFGNTWIYDYDNTQNKQFGVSTVIGNKEKTDGHITRQKLWMRRHEIIATRLSFSAEFFISAYGGPANSSSYPTLEKETYKKAVVFDYQYHIAIENVRRNNYFSEKLIDCFQTRTVPIYYGCPNIGDYFNMAGIITAESVSEIISKVNSLNPNDYENMTEAIESNYLSSQKYIVPPNDRLIQKLKERIK